MRECDVCDGEILNEWEALQCEFCGEVFCRLSCQDGHICDLSEPNEMTPAQRALVDSWPTSLKVVRRPD